VGVTQVHSRKSEAIFGQPGAQPRETDFFGYLHSTDRIDNPANLARSRNTGKLTLGELTGHLKDTWVILSLKVISKHCATYQGKWRLEGSPSSVVRVKFASRYTFVRGRGVSNTGKWLFVS